VALVVAAVIIGGDGEESSGATTTAEATTTSSSTTTTTEPTTTTTPLSPEDEIRRAAAELFERPVLQHLPGDRRAYGISLLGSAGNWTINDVFVGDQILPSVMEEIISLGVP
jgi:hypothetical protein